MKLVSIPAGSFMMGSNRPHEVRISKGFWMGQTEVTQGQYKSVMNAEPWSGQVYVQEANNPAIYVTWNDAVEFCKKLSQQTGETYRLPTEAEWEYACRAGTTTRFSFGDSDSSLGDYAWRRSNAFEGGRKYAHSVGQKRPNPWGLYDIHGNVFEWCSDWYDKDYYSNSPSVDPNGPSSGEARSLRGGSWLSYEYALRCSCRSLLDPDARNDVVGFRVVLSQS
ncbi:MAG: formylglycine-generating enzyme family protein [Planctomycetes bacterium]|nr:formylglycine-generating enzyme family protein [Planctomycetota bacterium]